MLISTSLVRSLLPYLPHKYFTSCQVLSALIWRVPSHIRIGFPKSRSVNWDFFFLFEEGGLEVRTDSGLAGGRHLSSSPVNGPRMGRSRRWSRPPSELCRSHCWLGIEGRRGSFTSSWKPFAPSLQASKGIMSREGRGGMEGASCQ